MTTTYELPYTPTPNTPTITGDVLSMSWSQTVTNNKPVDSYKIIIYKDGGPVFDYPNSYTILVSTDTDGNPMTADYNFPAGGYDGSSYQYSVTAHNNLGDGSESTYSQTVTYLNGPTWDLGNYNWIHTSYTSSYVSNARTFTFTLVSNNSSTNYTDWTGFNDYIAYQGYTGFKLTISATTDTDATIQYQLRDFGGGLLYEQPELTIFSSSPYSHIYTSDNNSIPLLYFYSRYTENASRTVIFTVTIDQYIV